MMNKNLAVQISWFLSVCFALFLIFQSLHYAKFLYTMDDRLAIINATIAGQCSYSLTGQEASLINAVTLSREGFFYEGISENGHIQAVTSLGSIDVSIPQNLGPSHYSIAVTKRPENLLLRKWPSHEYLEIPSDKWVELPQRDYPYDVVFPDMKTTLMYLMPHSGKTGQLIGIVPGDQITVEGAFPEEGNTVLVKVKPVHKNQ